MLDNQNYKSLLYLSAFIFFVGWGSATAEVSEDKRGPAPTQAECQEFFANFDNENQFQEERQRLLQNKKDANNPQVPEEIAQDIYGEEQQVRLRKLNRFHNGCK